MVKKGDTLIEVVLAVGIFSLVAIAVASVMNGGTSSAQASLEVTLAREEIDTQAEALRFIQSAYIAEKDSEKDDSNPENKSYVSQLWQEIKKNAVKLNQGTPSSEDQNLLSFSPTDCQALYNETDGEVFKYHAFVLDPTRLGETRGSSAYISTLDNSVLFKATETYPRIVYGNNENKLMDNNRSSVSEVDGLYIIAVGDASNTAIVSNNTGKEETAFYDFYIRSCWYNLDSDHPSTISTVIRLYNPDALDINTDN